MKKNFDMIYQFFVFFKGNCVILQKYFLFLFFCFQVGLREYGDDGDDPNAPVSTVEPEGGCVLGMIPRFSGLPWTKKLGAEILGLC